MIKQPKGEKKEETRQRKEEERQEETKDGKQGMEDSWKVEIMIGR